MRKIIYENPSTGESITFANDSGYGLTSLTGTGIPDVENTEQRAPSQDGTTWIETLLEPREIKADFICYNATPATAYETMRYVNRVLNCKTEPGKITYTNDYGTWVIYGTPDVKFKEYKVSENSGRPVGKVTFYCYDPYWQDEEDTLLVLSNLTEAQEIEITGDVPSPITAVITGSSNGPVLTEAVQSAKLDYNAISSKMLTITTGYGNKRVLEQNESIWSIKEQGAGVSDIIVVDGVYWGTVGTSVVSSVDGEDWTVRVSYKGLTISNLQHDGDKYYVYICGNNGLTAIAESTNGKDWTETSVGQPFGSELVTYVKKFFIIEEAWILFVYRGNFVNSRFYKTENKGYEYTHIFTSITDKNTTFGGILKTSAGYVFSVGYTNFEGILQTTDLMTFSVLQNVTPVLGSAGKFSVLGAIVISRRFYSTNSGISFSAYSSDIYYRPESNGSYIFADNGINLVYTLDGTTWTTISAINDVSDIKYNSIINRMIAMTTSGETYIVNTAELTKIKNGMPVLTITKVQKINDNFYLYGSFGANNIGITEDFSTITAKTASVDYPYDIAFFTDWFYLTSPTKLIKTQDFDTYTDAYTYPSGYSPKGLYATDTELVLVVQSNTAPYPAEVYFSNGTTATKKLTISSLNATATPSFVKTSSLYLVHILGVLYSSADGSSWSETPTASITMKLYKNGTNVYLFGGVYIYVSHDDGDSFNLMTVNVGQNIISLIQDSDYVYIVVNKTESIVTNFNYTKYQIYRSKPDMLFWERYDDGAIFPLNGIFYEGGLYGLYGDNGSIFATNGDNTPVNKIQNLTADSKFFSLQPGQNILKLDVDTGLAVAHVTYRNRYTGAGC